MPNAVRVWTREEVLALPDDGKRYELVDGELLVSSSPRGVHQSTVMEFLLRLAPYVRAHGLGAVSMSPADLDFRSGQVLQPDLFIGEPVNGREPIEWSDFNIPTLVIEVLSPSTARSDRVVKRKKFQRVGVPEYWIVDPDARLVDVWRPDDVRSTTVDGVLRWKPTVSVPALDIDLPGLFRLVWQD